MRFDEWIMINSGRIQPLFSKTIDWRSELKESDMVEINFEDNSTERRVWLISDVTFIDISRTWLKIEPNIENKERLSFRRIDSPALYGIPTNSWADDVEGEFWVHIFDERITRFNTHTHYRKRGHKKEEDYL